MSDLEAQSTYVHEPSAWIMICGRACQTIPLYSAISLIFGTGIATGVCSMLSIYSNDDLYGGLSIGTGLIGLLLTLLVYNAPFNVIRILNSTITHLQENNRQLEDQVTKLTRVEKGLKSTSETLLKLVSWSSSNNEQAQKINTAMQAVAEDIANATETQNASMSEFMRQLLSMEELEKRFNDTAEALQMVTRSVKMDDLARWIDNKADGEYGIRQTIISGQSLTETQQVDILEFLSKLDQIILDNDRTTRELNL